jgi:hypothetical protein
MAMILAIVFVLIIVGLIGCIVSLQLPADSSYVLTFTGRVAVPVSCEASRQTPHYHLRVLREVPASELHPGQG